MRINSFAVLLLFSLQANAANPLPRLNIESQSLTVSGLSSGAFMANQFLVAYSSVVKGAAAFAGGPYYCSKGQLGVAISACMNAPLMIDIGELETYAKERAAKGEIDELANLKDARLYIFASPIDSVVRATAGKQTQLLMSKWLKAENIQLVDSPRAEHGVPTKNFGNDCGKLGSPYLQNCQFDGVGAGLQFLYENKLASAREFTPEEKAGLVSFDQKKGTDGSGLLAEGLVFIPAACKAGSACKLHVAFHGCNQNTEFVGTVFAERAGYLNWAVANKMVVLFPQIAKSSQNPKGCWDWFGYTGAGFALKEGLQIKAVRGFVREISGF